MKIGTRHEAKVIGAALSATLIALCFSVEAQQSTKIPRIGLLIGPSRLSSQSQVDGFRRGLRQLRYVGFALNSRLPSMYSLRLHVDAGRTHVLRGGPGGQLPACCDLRGQNPQGREPCRSSGRAAEEVRARDQFEIVQQIGVTIPPNLLARADRVIK